VKQSSASPLPDSAPGLQLALSVNESTWGILSLFGDEDCLGLQWGLNMNEKIGRNDPCYCGSGKKYKQCHMKIEQELAKEERAWESAAGFLRRDLIAFAREERFAESFAAGISLFFNGYHTIETAQQMSEPESLRFFDWFTHDYAPVDRQRLIEVYHAEKGDLMDEKESNVLKGWLGAGPVSAYTLVDASGEGKQTLHLRNLLDDGEHVVDQSGGPGRAEAGDVLIARLLPFRDQIRMSGATGFLPAEEASELEPFILGQWESYQEDSPESNWADFARQRSYLLAHYELEAAKKAGRPPVARLDPNQPKSQVGQVMRRIKRRR
jgi:hypothetical protein